MKRLAAAHCIIVFCFTALNTYSQTINSISGKVISNTHEPIMGNVFVLSPSDSTFIKGDTYLDTAFVLTNLNRPEVLLKFSSLLFSDTIIKVAYNGQTHIDLGNIVMKLNNNELATVTVVSTMPLIKHNTNGTIDVNVANTVLSASSSVTEILSKSPNVIENNGQLSVIGKGEAILFLNGKLITNERLSSIPVSRIFKD